MRNIALAAALTLCAAAASAATADLGVFVKNPGGAPLAGVRVYAIHFSSTGPDALTQTAVTDPTGLASFTSGNGNALQQGNNFDVFAATQGFLPGLRDQFNDPTHPSVFAGNTSIYTPTITLSSFSVSNVAEIDVDFVNATPNALIFASMNPNGGGDAIAFGVGQADGAGSGRLTIYDAPFVAANTAGVSAYDSGKNRSAGGTLGQDLNASNPSIYFTGPGLDFNASNALPPSRTATQQNTASVGGLSVDGVVMDTNSVNTIPYVGLSLQGQYVQNFSTFTDQRWTNSDQGGHFQFYGLLAGVTYYMQAYSGCDNNGNCYTGFQSPNAPTTQCGSSCPGPATNDFVYPSTTTTLVRKVQLDVASGGSGSIAVYVQDSNGNPMPQAMVGVFPDNNQWETSGSCAGNQRVNNAGLATANLQATTGYALVGKLPSGNYIIGANTQFNSSDMTRFNDGANGQPCWQTGSCQCGTDDLRVTIDTGSVPDVKVFNSSGVLLGAAASSITITVPTSTGTVGGVLKGTLTFPQSGIDLSNDPVTIIVNASCSGGGQCPRGNLAFFNASSTGPTINYAIPLSTGVQYFMSVQSNFWGASNLSGGQQIVDLSSVSVVTMNLGFARAGRVLGHLYKPDGSLFQPVNSQNGASAFMRLSGVTVDGGSSAQVAQDGSFVIGGVLPGTYQLLAEGSGSAFTYANPAQLPTATVVAQKDVALDLNLVKGVPLLVTVSTANTPPIGFPDCRVFGRQHCPPEDYEALALPAGTVLDLDMVYHLLFHDETINRFHYIPDPTLSWDCTGQPTQPGFCVNRVQAPSNFDVYLLREGDFNPGTPNTARPYFTILSSTRNIVVNDQTASTQFFWSGSTLSVRPIDVTPAAGSPMGTAAANGSVSGSNIFRQADFQSLGGDLQNFIKFVPLISLYNSSGSLAAVGLSVPPPTCLAGNLTVGTTSQSFDAWMNQAVANGDFSLFQTVFNSCGSIGYDVRGLSTGTYTAIVTTPNYPPCQSSIALPVVGSTVTVNFNLDTCAGSGAVISGVVSSTNGVAIPNASVSVEADAYKQRVFTTNASGAYSVLGLGNGAYTLKVNASGFATQVALVNVSAAGSYTQSFSMPAGNASISGTVYAAKVPFVRVQPGAQIVAYDDTINIDNPNAELNTYKVHTDSAGYYQIDGLTVGDVYKVFVDVPGKFVTSQSTLTIAGLRGGIDFTLQSKPLDVQVSGRPNPPYYEFKVENPSDFKSGQVWISTSGGASFNVATSTEVDQMFMQLPDNQLLLDYPLAQLIADQDYDLHIVAQSLAGQTVTKDVVFGVNRKASSQQSIDQALLGDDSDDGFGHKNNQALLDTSGNNASAISIPAGAVIPVSSAAVPTVQFSNTDVNASTVAAMVQAFGASTAAFQSGIYQVTFSSLNYTTKGVDITLAYDKSNSNIADLQMQHFNTATNKWEQVPGLQTIDPVKGTITVKHLKSLASVLGLRPGHPLMAAVRNGTFVPSAASQTLIPDDQGAFSIVRPSIVGQPFTGNELKIFNFPNPFNLSSKLVPIVNGPVGTTSVGTDGTVIKYELPPGVSGHAVIRIYTISGELVQTLDEGDKTGGTYNYTTWNGKNRNGVSVANGVYYGVLSIPGAKAKDGRFKMAVIK